MILLIFLYTKLARTDSATPISYINSSNKLYDVFVLFQVTAHEFLPSRERVADEHPNIKKKLACFCKAVSFVTKTFLANPLISEIYDTLAAFGAQL